MLALGLATGGNSAVFSLVSHLLLQPLPYGDPESLVSLSGVDPRSDEETGLSARDVETVRTSRVFEGVGGFRQRPVVLMAGTEPETATVGVEAWLQRLQSAS